MNDEEGSLSLSWMAILGGLPDDGRPGEGDVAEVAGGRVPARKGEHVRGVVLRHEFAVQAPQLTIAGDADSQLGRPPGRTERGAEGRLQRRVQGRCLQHVAQERRLDGRLHGLHDHHPKTDNGALVIDTLVFLHGRLALALILLAAVLGVWGTAGLFFRRRISPGFRSSYLVMIGLTGVQGLIGVALITMTHPKELLHVVYGAFAILFLPGVYFWSARGNAVREAAFLAGACWIVAIAYGRGILTG